jgi:hypothetical protein
MASSAPGTVLSPQEIKNGRRKAKRNSVNDLKKNKKAQKKNELELQFKYFLLSSQAPNGLL